MKKWDDIESDSALDETDVDELVMFAEEVDLVSFLGSDPEHQASVDLASAQQSGQIRATEAELTHQAESLRNEFDHPVDSFTDDMELEAPAFAEGDGEGDIDAASVLTLLDQEDGYEPVNLRMEGASSQDEVMAMDEELLPDDDTAVAASTDLQPVLTPVVEPPPSRRGWFIVGLVAILGAMYGWSALNFSPTVPTPVEAESVRGVLADNSVDPKQSLMSPSADPHIDSPVEILVETESSPAATLASSPQTWEADRPEVDLSMSEPSEAPPSDDKAKELPQPPGEAKVENMAVVEPVKGEPVKVEPGPSVAVATDAAGPSSDRYYLQLGAFVTPRYLKQTQAQVEAAGLSTWLASRSVEIPMYRVRVVSDALGKIPTLEDLSSQYPDAYTLSEWGKDVVYLGAFVDAGNAKGLVKDFAELGGTARVEKATTATELKILRAGGYQRREDALRQANDLRTQGLQVLVVERR